MKYIAGEDSPRTCLIDFVGSSAKCNVISDVLKHLL